MTVPLLCDNIIFVTDNNRSDAANNGFSPAIHFGKQVRKARKARNWSIHQLADESGISAGHLSHIENGNRPPTEYIALAMDRTFPERHGWFLDYVHDSESWTPPGYRTWMDLEAAAATLRAWVPGVLHGLLQTRDYARATASALSDAPADVIEARTEARMERQRRILHGENPPTTWFVVDELSLYRFAGSPEIMAAQFDHLIEVAGLPDVMLQVMPAVMHPALACELIVIDNAAYCEYITGGVVHTDAETVATLRRMFNTIQAESLRASESLKIIGKVREAWISGEKAPTPRVTEGRASS